LEDFDFKECSKFDANEKCKLHQDPFLTDKFGHNHFMSYQTHSSVNLLLFVYYNSFNFITE